MDRPLSEVSYDGFTDDPDRLGVEVPGTPPPLGHLVEPDDQPAVAVDAPGDREPLVRLAHRRIRTLGCYWHVGWSAARPDTLLRSGAAARLGEVADALPEPFGLAVFDAWRPLALQAELWHAAYDDHLVPPGFVADPDPDPARPPAHLTGGTVDLTLTWHGRPLALGSPFDAFDDRAVTSGHEDRPGRVRDLRRLLVGAMAGAGFVVLDLEWWHFEWGTRRWAALRDDVPRYGPARPGPGPREGVS